LMCSNLLSINASRNRSSHRPDFVNDAIKQIEDARRSGPNGLLKHPDRVSVGF